VFNHVPDLHPDRTQDLSLPAPALNPIHTPLPSLWPEWCDAHFARLLARDFPQVDDGDVSGIDRDRTPARAASVLDYNRRLT
jgi:hypothetical protein